MKDDPLALTQQQSLSSWSSVDSNDSSQDDSNQDLVIETDKVQSEFSPDIADESVNGDTDTATGNVVTEVMPKDEEINAMREMGERIRHRRNSAAQGQLDQAERMVKRSRVIYN